MTSDIQKRSINLTNFSLIFVIILLDQLSKFLAEKIGLLTSCNRGIAFGLGDSGVFISSLVLVILLAIFIWQENSFSIGFLLILAGGLANLVDRIFVGCVRDFIKIGFWPAFNLADFAITIGVSLILYSIVFKSRKKET